MQHPSLRYCASSANAARRGGQSARP